MNQNQSFPFVALARTTLTDPRSAARYMMSINLDRVVGWQALILTAIVSVLALQVDLMAQPVPDPTDALGAVLIDIYSRPAIIAMLQVSLSILLVFATYWIGHALGGKAKFSDTIAVIAWHQAIMASIQLLQLVALVLIPMIVPLLAVVWVVMFFWLLTQFITELHGFERAGMVFVMILVSIVGIIFGLSVAISVILAMFLGEGPNV